MREMTKMIIVLTILSVFSGGLLAAVRNGTKDQIENQQLQFVKGPAIKSILKGASNDPISDRFKLEDAGAERSFFVGIIDGQADAVAFESFGKGYGGDLGVMIGVNIKEDKIIGVGITTHSETPGVGSRAKSDPAFAAQFKGLNLEKEFKVKPDGGQVDAISGATLTSRGIAVALSDAGKLYERLKPQITEKLKSFSK